MARDLYANVGAPPCPNMVQDIVTLQELLNKASILDPYFFLDEPLPTDGIVDSRFVEALKSFQSNYPKLRDEIGRIVPGGRTMAQLNACDDSRVLTRESVMKCSHGGSVTIVTTGKPDPMNPALALGAVCMVSGCPLPNNPCARVSWVSSAWPNFLDLRSVGMCQSVAGVPTGPVIIAFA